MRLTTHRHSPEMDVRSQYVKFLKFIITSNRSKTNPEKVKNIQEYTEPKYFILAYPDFKLAFDLATDASPSGIGAVLFLKRLANHDDISYIKRLRA